MNLTNNDLDRLEKLGIGGAVTYEEQIALITLARTSLTQRGTVFECPDCGYKVQREEVNTYLDKMKKE